MKKEFNLMKELFDFIKTIIICFLLVYLITQFLFRPIKVKGTSMYPTLNDGDYGISNVILKNINGINRFDIVVIKLKDSNEYLIKRVIGLPNDVISYKDDKLYINGNVVSEEFLNTEYVKNYISENFTDDIQEIVVNDNEYFCMGDNRPHSRDSRYYGTFFKEQIISKDVFVVFPLDRFGSDVK